MLDWSDDIPAGYSYSATAAWFAAGAAVTAVFSSSLVSFATNAKLTEVLFVGLFVPSFTWLAQLTVAAVALSPARRQLYWGDLARVCLLGSIALLPAAVVNLCLSRPPLWLSAANVLASVALMGVELFRRSARHGISPSWPLSWCLTIVLNMGLFTWSSWHWW